MRAQELQDILKKASTAYYMGKPSGLTDQQFDLYLKELEGIERSTGIVTEDSITKRVGCDLSPGFAKVAHTVPMLSIDNSYNEAELTEYVKSVCVPGQTAVDFFGEFKVDGVSLALVYTDGHLTQATTRGDGSQGDDVTENARAVQDIPHFIPGTTGVVEVRGEVVMPQASFIALNKRLYAAGKATLQNPRNATSGTIKMKNVAEAYKRGLSFRAFDIVRGSDLETLTHFEKRAALKGFGFHVAEGVPMDVAIIDGVPDVSVLMDYVGRVDQIRKSNILPYDIDGIVFKLSSADERKRLGRTTKHVKWATAWKFEAQEALTVVKSVTLQIGRTGRITPVAELEPVRLAGTTVSRATLHNFEEIERLGLMVGDTVTIEKGGEIIPKITGVDETLRGPACKEIARPTVCPECGGAIEASEDVDIRCGNFASCPPQVQRRLEHFVGRDYMRIDDVGPALIEDLIEFDYVNKPFDFFTLTRSDLVVIPGLGGKSVTKLLDNIERAKSHGAERLLAAMGFRHVGRRASKDLLSHFKTLDKVWSATKEEFLTLEGFGEETANALVQAIKENPNFIADCTSCGLNLEYGAAPLGDKLQGLTVVITGTLPTYDRDAMKKILEDNGAKVTGSVSKNTSMLLCGADAGSKLDRANSLGVKVVEESYFVDLLEL